MQHVFLMQEEGVRGYLENLWKFIQFCTYRKASLIPAEYFLNVLMMMMMIDDAADDDDDCDGKCQIVPKVKCLADSGANKTDKVSSLS